MPLVLRKAIHLWRQDRELPVTLYAELVDLGYDVPALENLYRN